ncbi:MAG: homoserine kinase [Bacillota bacterium]
MCELYVPATSANLGPGFDSLGLALKLYNKFSFERIDQGLEIEVLERDGTVIDIPVDDNLIYKAVNRFTRDSGIKVEGLRITEISSIPLARGLGSSATAIVGTLSGLNQIYDRPLTQKRLLDIAVSIEGHSDNVVPACVGGFVINVLKGNKLNYRKIPINNPGVSIVLIIPDFELKTSDLRAVLPGVVDFQDALFNQSRTALLASIFCDQDWELLSVAMEDRLHQDYRAKLIPGFKAVVDRGYTAGADGVALSGAGPTVIAFTRYHPRQVAREMVKTFARHDVTSNYIITGIDNMGVNRNSGLFQGGEEVD